MLKTLREWSYKKKYITALSITWFEILETEKDSERPFI